MSAEGRGRFPGRALAAVLALAPLVAACASDGGDAASPSASGPPPAQVVAIVASVDLWAGDPQRVSVGLVTNENELVSYGAVDFAFSYIGTAEEPSEPQPGPTATATFVPTYGTQGGGDVPAITLPSEARGVYEATDVTFDRAGFWQVTVTADVEGIGPQTALATLPVAEEPALPAPGEPALPTENLTLDSKGVPAAAIDSRAGDGGEVPDPELHRSTIAAALEDGRPALVVFATPVYCVSQFCGPVTDMVQDLAGRYDDRATFIHVEIWEDYEGQALNEAATDWLRMPSGELTEPWLYLIDADGVILDRWSSLWSEEEVVAALETLPRGR
ncbi:MAG TPA: hypothetical protein VFZ96_07610 [Actinomycetota bacterium]|nr:hypothetical protein [Actinomycetota bacterium]